MIRQGVEGVRDAETTAALAALWSSAKATVGFPRQVAQAEPVCPPPALRAAMPD